MVHAVALVHHGHMHTAATATARVAHPPLHDELRRARSEYLEMPGLSLTVPHARRLLGLDLPATTAVLGALVESHFLVQTRFGAFVRAETY